MNTISLKNTHTNAEETNNTTSSAIIERNEIKDSPFIIITAEGRSFGVMAEYRLTEYYKTKEEVEKELKNITWNKIIQVTALLIEKLK